MVLQAPAYQSSKNETRHMSPKKWHMPYFLWKCISVSSEESAALLSVCTAAAELSLSLSEDPLSEQPAMPKAITTANKRADIFFIMLPPYFFNKFILQHSPMQVNNIFDIYKYFVKYPQTAIVFLQHNVVRKAQHNVV
jgi:hypothetical protein